MSAGILMYFHTIRRILGKIETQNLAKSPTHIYTLSDHSRESITVCDTQENGVVH